MQLMASDGHAFNAYVPQSTGPRRGALIVIQEIFGVNSHIRSVADDYTSQGYWTVAPALFDRVQPNLELGYGPEDRKKGVQAASQLGPEMALKDVQASIEYARDQLGMRVGVLGFCWGGTVAWLAATRLQSDAVVAYYGGQIAKHSAEKPTCPVQLHFGKLDAHIPMSEIDAIRRHHPEVPIFLYDAGHGFNCDQRESYEPVSAALARQRTLQFLQENL
jgi:carboxymethylenebutenolidase